MAIDTNISSSHTPAAMDKRTAFYNGYSYYRTPDGKIYSHMARAKNIEETRPSPPTGWETKNAGWYRTPGIIARFYGR